MPQVTRDNHFVPQAYLRRWSDGGKQIYAYRTLVSHDQVPEWSLKPIRGVAYRRDLYTICADGQEVDDFERWLTTEFEEPARDAIKRVVRDAPLRSVDWERLALFMAAQDLRTPSSFVESMQRWQTELPELIDRTLRKSVQLLEEATRQGVQPVGAGMSARPNPFRDSFKVRIEPADGAEDQSVIRASVTVDKGLWLASMKHLLTGVANIVRLHKWSILTPMVGTEWITSDHPVLKLNYYGGGRYDFRGGWGNPGTDLIFPLSPRHLLYTQVGAEAPDRFALPADKAKEIQRFLAERAYRWIFAHRPLREIATFRPRRIDASAVKVEEQAWHGFHDDYR